MKSLLSSVKTLNVSDKTRTTNKILVAAMKQSLKAHLPHLNKAVSWKEFIQQKFNTDRFIAHCGEGRKTFETMAKTTARCYDIDWS